MRILGTIVQVVFVVAFLSLLGYLAVGLVQADFKVFGVPTPIECCCEGHP